MKQRPRFYVDFNELIEQDLVALSKNDNKSTENGDVILLFQGLQVEVYSDDVDDKGEKDNLIASGVVEGNSRPGWAKDIKWCCRIDGDGIRHESDLRKLP